MPDDLIPQIELVKNMVDALNLPRFEQPGADCRGTFLHPEFDFRLSLPAGN